MTKKTNKVYCKICGKVETISKNGICKECSKKIREEHLALEEIEKNTCICGRTKIFEGKLKPNTTYKGIKTLCPFCLAKKIYKGRYIALYNSIASIYFNTELKNTIINGICENIMNPLMYISKVSYYKLDIPELKLYAELKKESLTDEHINGRMTVSYKFIHYICTNYSHLMINSYIINNKILDEFIDVTTDYLLKYDVTIPTSKAFNQLIKPYQNNKDENNIKINISSDLYIEKLEMMLSECNITLLDDSKNRLKKHMYE